jgi:predicted dehydrogenase
VEPVRVAIIGCGAIARLHVERLRKDGRARIIAVCDQSPAVAQKLRDDQSLPAQVFTELSRLLGDCPVDAAVICTPTLFHFEQVAACRERGVHVLCEKPLADTRERIVALIDQCRFDGPKLSVAYQRRYDPLFRTLRREVQSGRWGPVQSITTHSAERWQQTIAGTWRDDPAINPGGFLGDAGSHKIDMVFFVTGLSAAEVFAHSDRCGSRVEIVTTINGRMVGGAHLSMNFIGNAQHWREDLHVHCADADWMIRDGAVWFARNNRVEKFDQLEPASNPNSALLDMVLDGRPNDAPPDCALPVFDFTRSVLESARAATGLAIRRDLT